MIALSASALNLRAFFSGGVKKAPRDPPGDLAGGEAATNADDAASFATCTNAVSLVEGALPSASAGNNPKSAWWKQLMSLPMPPNCFREPGAAKCACVMDQFSPMLQDPETSNHSGNFAWQQAHTTILDTNDGREAVARRLRACSGTRANLEATARRHMRGLGVEPPKNNHRRHSRRHSTRASGEMQAITTPPPTCTTHAR